MGLFNMDYIYIYIKETWSCMKMKLFTKSLVMIILVGIGFDNIIFF
jgi:hypothetical protein